MPESPTTGRERVRARYRMRRHAIMRARTRFGVILATEDLSRMRLAIEKNPDHRRSRSMRFVGFGDGREIWAVDLGHYGGGRNIWVSLVFDRSLNAIVTFKGMYRGEEMSDA